MKLDLELFFDVGELEQTPQVSDRAHAGSGARHPRFKNDSNGARRLVRALELI